MYPVTNFSGELQPYPQVLGFSQWCIIYAWFLFDLVRGTEVWNDVCHHLDDITSGYFVFIFSLLLLYCLSLLIASSYKMSSESFLIQGHRKKAFQSPFSQC